MLFKNYHVIILNDPSVVDSLTRKAANHNLHCLYKSGVYGCEQQHELYVIGKTKDYRVFKKEISETIDG